MSLRDFIDRLRGAPKWDAPEGNGLEHDDWRVGDLAECATSKEWIRHMDGCVVDGPRKGLLLRVCDVSMIDNWHCLAFEGWDHWWTAECFLKIRPSQRQACQPWFKRMVKGLRPKVVA